MSSEQSGIMLQENTAYRGRLQGFWMQIRREFWEHRMLTWLPIALLALVLVGTLISLAVPGRLNQQLMQNVGDAPVFNSSGLGIAGVSDFKVQLGELSVGAVLGIFEKIPPPVRGNLIELASLSMAKSLFFPLAFVLLFYLAASLYNEHKRKTSLFWKSMPTTSLEMVLAKVATGMIAFLGIMWLTAMLANLIVLLVMSAAALFTGYNPWELFWGPAGLARIGWITFAQLVVDALWFLPGVGAILAVNAWGLRNRIIVPVVLFATVVLDRIWFGGGHVWPWMSRHFLPPGFEQRGMMMERMGRLVEDQNLPIEFSKAFDLDFWSGILIGCLLIYLASRLYLLREEK